MSKIKEWLNDDGISLVDMYNNIIELENEGEIEISSLIHSREVVDSYIDDLRNRGIASNHILKVLDENIWCDFFHMDMCYSWATITPIDTKERLVEFMDIEII